MVLHKSSLRMLLPILLLLVLTSNFALYRSTVGASLLPANTNPVVLVIDLTLVTPFILFEVVLLLTLFTYLPVIIRSVKKSSLPLLFSLAVFVNFVVCNKKYIPN